MPKWLNTTVFMWIANPRQTQGILTAHLSLSYSYLTPLILLSESPHNLHHIFTTVEHQIIYYIKFYGFSQGSMNLRKLYVVKMDRGDYPFSSCVNIKSIALVVAETNAHVNGLKY